MALHLLYNPSRLEQLQKVVRAEEAIIIVDEALEAWSMISGASDDRLPCAVHALANERVAAYPSGPLPNVSDIQYEDWVNLARQHTPFVEWK